MSLLATAWDRFGAFLAPPRCSACDEPTGPRVAFCARCARTIERTSSPGAAFVYGGAIAGAISRFKYTPTPELGVPLGLLLSQAARERTAEVDAVIPVPLHATRLVERGFNQSTLLARPVARALGVPLFVRALERTRPTPRQAELDRAARLRNVAGAFRARPRPRLEGLRVLLVDDVRTTGATERACAQALREAGCREVHSLVLAIAAPIAYP
ncbi:MAG TPA: ComF family protein [Polyangiaceae bacterium]|nr:ComF family protein [Polyangiaceae bacterium]